MAGRREDVELHKECPPRCLPASKRSMKEMRPALAVYRHAFIRRNLVTDASSAVARAPRSSFDTDDVRKQAMSFFKEQQYDTDCLHEQPIIWGMQDLFQHVNNVHTFRFFETGLCARHAGALSNPLRPVVKSSHELGATHLSRAAS